jgi:hypothetical protein
VIRSPGIPGWVRTSEKKGPNRGDAVRALPAAGYQRLLAAMSPYDVVAWMFRSTAPSFFRLLLIRP